ncbi:right-handed parallel beta-helix repeat-containing protein [Pseudonocardia sp. DSM 110487]|uniref:right-handed parallel beta-helix repeat-containing protein n=1 Tax=Pseudonocardia sp. DSM 110487 TaxID=2865833 RepID=UPI001C69DE3E|nr:right-handed parallel beta-helix repeat-containing protein [Pseudonocardia sp. DSM 110487]QYN37202.1 right-handed parallel beta-helix repeat-containing protein [Pseudonocardia sp. DSM 110487]
MTGRHRLGRLAAAGAVLGTVGVLLSGELFGGVANAAPAPARVHPAAPTAVHVAVPLQVPPPDPEAAERAAAQARARAQAAARAARAAAKRAEAARKVRVTWEKRGRPHRMAVVRTNRIDVVTDGRLTRQIGRGGGAITISTLDRALPSDWLATSDGTATLSAAIVLTPGTALEVGDPIKRLELIGGATPQDAAAIYTGSGRVSLKGVTLTSADPATRQAVAPTSPGRPFVAVSARGRFDAVDSTISDLGTPSTGIDGGRAGVTFNLGALGSLVRTTLQRNTTGVELSRSDAVHLEDVAFTESVGDGLVLTGDRGTTMKGIRAVGNGDNGVVVAGESSDRAVTGITTSGNGGYGVVVIGQTGTTLSGIATTGDQSGGLRINRSTDLRVTDFSATDQPAGVYVHVSSARIALDHVRTSGGRRGVVVEKSTDGLELRDSSIDGSRVAGVGIGGKHVLLSGVRISDSRAAVRVERGAVGIRLAGLVVEGGRDGVVTTPGTTGVVIADLMARNVASDAVRTASTDAEIIGGRITGGTTGIDVAAACTISGITIDGAAEGIHSRSPDLVRADEVRIDALDLGVNAMPGSPFHLTGSSVHALEALRGPIQQHGTNDLSLPPLNLLSAIGLPLILLAIVLEQVHTTRQRRAGVRRRRLPPVPVGATG